MTRRRYVLPWQPTFLKFMYNIRCNAVSSIVRIFHYV